jgi:hypothetical protein
MTPTVTMALELIIALISRAGEISSIIKQAREEGREELKPEEWEKIEAADAAARESLAKAIERAKEEGR